jgi:hypothetical protein
MQPRYYLYLAVSTLTLGVSGFLCQGLSQSGKKIPTPQIAVQQAEKLTPEQLTQVEVDEEIRDKLRTDPEWMEITTAIRQDMMVLKWGKGKPQNPVWKKYGGKAYPLLDYYTRSKDSVRQEYAVLGIRSLGKPYTTLWLTRHIQRKLTTPDIGLVTTNLKSLTDGTNDDIKNEKAWEKEFGLDEKATRDRIIKLAQQNLKPESSASEYQYNNYYQFNESEFNKDFLAAVLGYDKVYPYPPQESESTLNLPEWSKFERLTQPNPSQIKSAITYYRNLPAKNQERLLVERLGQVKAGKISPIGKAVLQSEANDPKSKDQVWAIAELERHGDSQGTKQLQQIINGDLSQLHPLTSVTGYESHTIRNSHAYSLLINITQRYPQSKFIKGCREYGDLIGASYFDHAERSKAIRERNAKKTAVQRSQDWQQWLSKYPSHPGADDATYHLARSLQDKNDVMGAMRLWNKLMTQSVGDGDAIYLVYPHVRSLLDVGLTNEQLETLLKEPAIKPIVPLLEYALSVRYARGQNYAKALETSAKLDLTKMPNNVLGSYYNFNPYWWAGAISKTETVVLVQKQMQTMLIEQRQRWQSLLKLQQENTPDSQYRLASNWAGAGGWKNGYMAIWDGFRAWHVPLEECGTWWVCNMKKRDPNLVRSLYQDSSQNAVAISQYQKLLNNPRITPQLKEKTLYMVASTLLWQWENHPKGETLRIHPLAGVPGKPQNFFFDVDYSYNGNYEAINKQMQRDYQSRVDQIISELKIRFPQSGYIDDLLFSNYYLSGKPEYLEQIVQFHPTSDRVGEAKFLLENKSK